MSTRRPPPRSDRPPPAPATAARGVVVVIVAVGLGLLLLWKGLDGPSSAGVVTQGNDPGADGADTSVAVATTLVPPTTTAPPAVYDPQVKVIVANGSGVGGAAGRMQERLGGELGALLGNPTNLAGGTRVDQTTVYFTNPQYEPSARAIAATLSSTTAQVAVLPLPSAELIENGDIQGAGVVVALGRDLATTA